MPGSRHAKNNTALGYFTRHEREALGWGSKRKRLTKDSIKKFYACTICLKLCDIPLVCPNGDLFCKQCIYQSLLTQKQRNKQKLHEYQSQQQLQEEKVMNEHRKHTVDKFLQFDKLQHTHSKALDIASKGIINNTNNSKPILSASDHHDKQLSCFWIRSVEYELCLIHALYRYNCIA